MDTTIPIHCPGCQTENWLSVSDILSKLRVLNSFTPIGQVLVWTGDEANIPEGWAIANGKNGTIDLGCSFINTGNTNDIPPIVESQPVYYPCYYIQKIA